MSSATGSVHIFGIRHHGPGSARSVRAALLELQPDRLLIEGPPEGDSLLPLVESEAMRPPVAMLVYSPGGESGSISAAAYYPFTAFSPEWQAMRYGISRGIPVRLIDLPLSNQLAMMPPDIVPEAESAPPDADPSESGELEFQPAQDAPALSGDPLNALAHAAGYSEGEQWWEHLVEQRRDPSGVFAAILEAMTALRQAIPADTHQVSVRREAAMRLAVREALQAGSRRVAVVCGAWHAPALVDRSNPEEDAALLRNLPRIPLQATWVPWTYPRLTRAGGYGAGIESPGWYEHLWTTEQDVAVRWMIQVARLLRGEDVDVSSAHVIEAVRLAEGLAALRDRPLPGLPELNEAALAVYCFGNPTPLRLIEQKLIVGEKIGSVPPETPMAPLQEDFDRQVRRLRLPLEAGERYYDLDLRKPTDLERSHLFHRLSLLEIAWGKNDGARLMPGSQGRGGTFHEMWRVKWQPEYAVRLIEAGQWGRTIAGAAAYKASQEAALAPDLESLTFLIENVLLADLPEAVHEVVACLQAQAAVSSDTNHLMLALPPLANVLRYGNVRNTDSAMITGVVDGLVARICIGLGPACVSLGDDTAAEMYDRLVRVDEAISRLSNPQQSEAWQKALEGIAAQEGVHGLVSGRAVRILLDHNALDPLDAARRLGLALSAAAGALYAASWFEGFLRGSGTLMIHDGALLGIVDRWITGLPPDAFNQVLPLLRRTFATFPQPERRAIGERVKGGPARSRGGAGLAGADFDEDRADAVIPLAARLLGIPLPPPEESA